jgi:hypothetical protein
VGYPWGTPATKGGVGTCSIHKKINDSENADVS